MEILISLLVICAIVAVLIWFINLIPFPAGLEILKTILIIIVVIMAIIRVLPML